MSFRLPRYLQTLTSDRRLSNALECTYAAPSIAAWVAVAEAVALPELRMFSLYRSLHHCPHVELTHFSTAIPKSAGFTAIGLGIFTVAMVVIKHLWIPKKFWGYIPNWNAVGLAFVVPQVFYPIAMAAGSTFNYVWMKRNPASFDMYMFAVAVSLI